MSRKARDLVGRKFDKLTVVSKNLEKTNSKQDMWNCVCICGGTKVARGSRLLNGETKNCGCEHGLVQDLTGQQFGRLTVIKRIPKNNKGKGSEYLCRCDCGIEKIIRASDLKNGTKSCGNHHLEYMQECRKYNKYELFKDYGVGYCTNTNSKFYFDLEDYDLIKQFTWFQGKNKYATTHYNNKSITMHRLIMGFPNKDVDHINKHNTLDTITELDNRKCNLRICTHAENMRNKKKPKNNTSGHKGVTYSKRNNKWIAQIRYNNKSFYIGSYKNIEQAVKARHQKELELYGDFACLD